MSKPGWGASLRENCKSDYKYIKYHEEETGTDQATLGNFKKKLKEKMEKRSNN